MSFDKIVIIIMAVFSALGALDRIFGNRLGLGRSYESGIKTIAELSLSMIGIIVLAPVLANLLEPVIVPFYKFLGADAAIFAGTLLACDMGGAPLASELASSPEAASLGGLICASMLGATVSFTIPVAMSAIADGDKKYAAKGILCGVITVPIGIFAGGLAAGFSAVMVLKNCVPIILFSLLIALGLWKAERILIKGFELFGKLITAVATVGLVAAGIELTTDFVIIPNLSPITDAFAVVGEIAIVLSGAFPLIAVITKLLKKPFKKLGKALKMNETSVSGLVATLANSIATFDMVKNMDERGKIVNMAFAVSGAFVLGDHLAFTAGYNSSMIGAVIVGKLAAGICAVMVALFVTKQKGVKNEKTKL